MDQQNQNLYATAPKPERFILAAVEENQAPLAAEASLDELSDLLRTAGGEEAGRVIQKRQSPDPGTYLGSGKLEELRSVLEMTGADGVITDDELSPAQLRNMADFLDCKVIDRTLLILEIFTQRAATREGQLQVELAEWNYRLTRLVGLGKSLSRQGGSIGRAHSRGAGETKLELDRRYIRQRIGVLRHQLKELGQERETIRSRRVKNEVPHVALVGYTNAGKSTIFNGMTHAGVLEEDALFATLDTTTRRVSCPSGREILLSDTVGFIHKLPHQLVEAFRATLEEVCYADILLMVVDASDPKAQLEMQVTAETLRELGAGDKLMLVLFNKQDLLEQENLLTFPGGGQRQMRISAKRPEDLQRVLEQIDAILDEQEMEYTVLIPYTEGRFVNYLRENARVLEEDYRDNGTWFRVRSDAVCRKRLDAYRVWEENT